MNYSEKEMREILNQDIQISDTVNRRLKETYKMLKTESNQKKQSPRRRKIPYAAAIATVITCLAIPGAVYAASNLDFFEAMFGNSTKQSTPAIETEVDTGKFNEDGSPKMTAVTIPSHEFVSVDPQQAQALTGGGCMEAPIEKQIGDHTLRIENMVYDQNSAVIYFTLERSGSVTLLIGNEDTNVRKGAYFAEDRTYGFSFETTSDMIFGCDNIYVDTEKSTSDKMHCTAYLVWSAPLSDGVFPQLKIEKYPFSMKEYMDMPVEESEQFYAQIETEEITLTDQKPIQVQRMDLGEKGCIEYSPISIGIDLAKGLGLTKEEAYDPGQQTYLEIKYKDGSSYVIHDSKNNIENSGYVLGGVGASETWTVTAFNRLVDINEIQEIIVNDVTFPVE